MPKASLDGYQTEAVVVGPTSLLKPGNEDCLRTFHAKWHDVRQGQGRLNILHIGGSHVQAGEMSNQVRMHFEPAADRGLLFPHFAVGTNGAYSFKLGYEGMWKGERIVSRTPSVEMGLMGSAAITSDKAASLTLILRDSGRWNFSQLAVLGEASDPSVEPFLVTTQGDTLWADPILSRIADVQGAWVFAMNQPDSLVTLRFKGLTRNIVTQQSAKQYRKQYHPLNDAHYFTLRGLLPGSNRSGVTYQEAGVNGAHVPAWLRTSNHFEQELSLVRPDLAIFGIGVNDANVPEAEFNAEEYKANYRQLIARILSVSPDCRFVFVTNNDCGYRHGSGRKAYYTPNRNGARVEQAMLELAEEYDGAVFDLYALMGGLGTARQWIAAGYMKRDQVHFTVQGYHLIGDLLYNALAEDYDRCYCVTAASE